MAKSKTNNSIAFEVDKNGDLMLKNVWTPEGVVIWPSVFNPSVTYNARLKMKAGKQLDP